MRCPYCRAPESKVLESRNAEETAIRRRRECLACGKRFTTFERVEEMPLYVFKRDGRRESFDRGKIRHGLLTAAEKRPVAVDTLDEVAARVEGEIRDGGEREVSSRRIGEMVMEELRRLDEVAYIRFASVYRSFDLHHLQAELDRLTEEKGEAVEPNRERPNGP